MLVTTADTGRDNLEELDPDFDLDVPSVRYLGPGRISEVVATSCLVRRAWRFIGYLDLRAVSSIRIVVFDVFAVELSLLLNRPIQERRSLYLGDVP